MSLPWTSARLAAWAAAFLAGDASPDAAVDGITHGAVHRVVGLGRVLDGPGRTGTDDAPLGLSLALGRLRTAGARASWLVWPRPGDPGGLPGPSTTNAVVLEAGQGVVLELDGGPGLVLVPSGLGADAVLWTVLGVERADAARTDLAEADRELRVTLRESTEALVALDVARAPGSVDRLATARRRAPKLVPPPGWPVRARGVLDTAQRLVGVLGVARADDGGAVTAREARARREALGELERAARRAFVAAVNSRSEERVRDR